MLERKWNSITGNDCGSNSYGDIRSHSEGSDDGLEN